jgi:hypothetical protein
MFLAFLAILWVSGVIASAVWAHEQRRSVLMWTTAAIFFSPLFSLVCLTFGAMSRAFKDGQDCSRAGFVEYRRDWRTAEIRCPGCEGTGQYLGKSCQLCVGRRTVSGEVSKRFKDRRDQIQREMYENPNYR